MSFEVILFFLVYMELLLKMSEDIYLFQYIKDKNKMRPMGNDFFTVQLFNWSIWKSYTMLLHANYKSSEKRISLDHNWFNAVELACPAWEENMHESLGFTFWIWMNTVYISYVAYYVKFFIWNWWLFCNIEKGNWQH